MSSYETRTIDGQRRNRRVAIVFSAVAVGMLGMAYAAVPLYRMFCQLTGYDGTPRRAETASAVLLDRTVTIRFDANIQGLSWTFEPVQRKMEVRIGENALAFYRARNTSDRHLTGTATFNVLPEVTAGYFNKLACFCFTEQTLAPGESIEMPVSFFVDPAIIKDKDAGRVQEITLSYTFYPVDKAAVAVRSETGTKTETGTGNGATGTASTGINRAGRGTGAAAPGGGG